MLTITLRNPGEIIEKLGAWLALHIFQGFQENLNSLPASRDVFISYRLFRPRTDTFAVIDGVELILEVSIDDVESSDHQSKPDSQR
jgi:hypothetical protein